MAYGEDFVNQPKGLIGTVVWFSNLFPSNGSPRKNRTDMQASFVAVTKLDVTMNSLVMRAKYFGCII